MPKLKIGTKEDGKFGKFIVVDENGVEYGPSGTRKEVEEYLKLWKEYYAAPMTVQVE